MVVCMLLGGTVLVILLFAVFAVLVAGVILMGTGGAKNRKYGNKLMAARVGFQLLVLLTILAIYFLTGSK